LNSTRGLYDLNREPAAPADPVRVLAGGRRGRCALRPARALARARGSDPAGDPQDPPRGDRDAGEPLVRFLLRHVPRRRRPPSPRRQVHCVRPRPAPARVPAAVPRHGRPQLRRTARAARRREGHQRRTDERLHPPGQAWPSARLLAAPDVADLLARRASPRPHGLPPRPRDPELLGLRAALRPPGPRVRAGRLVEPAGTPVHGLGMVSTLPAAGRPDDLRERARDPARPAAGAPEPDGPY